MTISNNSLTLFLLLIILLSTKKYKAKGEYAVSFLLIISIRSLSTFNLLPAIKSAVAVLYLSDSLTLFFFSEVSAYAYIDPGLGSIILQALATFFPNTTLSI